MGVISVDEVNISIRESKFQKYFELFIPNTIDENITTKLFNQLPKIQELTLSGKLSYFSLHNLVDLKMLRLDGTLNENFNFELITNYLSNRLMALYLCIDNEDDIFHKLLDGHHFSNLQVLRLSCNMRRVNKKFLSQFPMLVELRMEACNLEMIEDDAFSNSKNLVCLHLSYNYLETLEKPVFFAPHQFRGTHA